MNIEIVMRGCFQETHAKARSRQGGEYVESFAPSRLCVRRETIGALLPAKPADRPERTILILSMEEDRGNSA